MIKNDADVTYPDEEEDDGHSIFQKSVVSEITYGSEFEDLLPDSA